jgi:hypothetical protein
MAQRFGPGLGGLVTASICLLACERPDDVIATLAASGGQMIDQGGAPSIEMSPCALASGESAALARYDFEDAAGSTTLRDAHSLMDAQLQAGSFAPVPGPPGCGSALGFGSEGLFAQIPNQPAWDLELGSVDFWVRVPEVSGTYGVVSRDHLGTDLSGHLSFWITPDNTVTARLQGAAVHATHCSAAPLAAGQWVHVGLNFGAPGSELFVDGQLATRTGDPRVETIVPECGGSTPDGVAGNEQPWVLGFDASRSGDMLDGLLSHFSGGALDALQISAVRRNFQRP